MNALDKVRAAVNRRGANAYYALASRFGSDNLVCLNLGYEEDPPMGVHLSESDEADRYPLQMYHRTAAQVDLVGKQVLEVSCGHGGGASYVHRTLGPKSYTGLDLNRAGIEFCRRRHRLPGMDFVQGHAEKLPFGDQSFDAVINIEAATYYPDFPRFLREVARVLRPGGHFLYSDLRPVDSIAHWEADLDSCPMQLESMSDISTEVARGLELNTPRLQKLNARYVPRPLASVAFTNIVGTLRDSEFSYRTYCFVR